MLNYMMEMELHKTVGSINGTGKWEMILELNCTLYHINF